MEKSRGKIVTEKWPNSEINNSQILHIHFMNLAVDTLMPLYHCHKPVFRPKMAIILRAGMREGGLPLPLAFQYLILMI